MKRVVSMTISPLLCIGLLTGLSMEAGTRLRPEDAEPYHARAKAAIDSIPYQLDGWYGQDEEVPPAAVKLLRPNTMFSRTYVNPSKNARAALLIVQCKDSRDMLGHYPPVCYPAHGMTQAMSQPRTIRAGELDIPFTEYQFDKTSHEATYKMTVYNFMIVPGVGMVRDMSDVSVAAKDYQQRYFGAAQFQVTCSADYSSAQRDEIFAALIGPCAPIIRTLRSPGDLK